MKKALTYGSLLLILASGIPATSCKNKKQETTTVDNNTNPPAPVEVSGDEELRKGVADATKDHPGVNATVDNGTITLTGEIKSEDLQRLMPALHALKPKNINNNLTVK